MTEQDELTRALHQTAVETIQMCTDAPMEAFLIEFEAAYPVLFNTMAEDILKTKPRVS